MKKNFLKAVAIVLASSFLLSSCSSMTMIATDVPGADVYLNGEYAGATPVEMRDTKIVGSTTAVKIEKEGYQTVNASITRDEKADIGAIIGGIFFVFPFLWTMKYKPQHNYVMKPIPEQD